MSKRDKVSDDEREERSRRAERREREEKQKISRADVARHGIEEARGGRRRDGSRRPDDDELEELDADEKIKEKRRQYIEEGDSQFGPLDTKSASRSDESVEQHRHDTKVAPDPAPDDVDDDLKRNDPNQEPQR